MSYVSIRDLRKSYGDVQTLHGLNLGFEEGEFVVIVGPSGCGKSTLLRMIAGLEDITSGEIGIGGQVVNDVEPADRGCAMVFQNYALYPHMTVAGNIGYPLKLARVPRAEREQRVREAAEILGLTDYLDRRPKQLSGGQRQRVAMGRAIVRQPRLFLFDEPLSNLDAKLRVDMRVEIRRLQQANGTTALYVTHDQEEAFSISDRVAIMNAGKIMQLDTPEVLYSRPANTFVADFVGFENMIPLRAVAEAGDAVRAEMPGGAILTLPKSQFTVPSKDFILATRPEGLLAAQSGEGIPTTLGLRTYLGRAYQYQCDTPAGEVKANGPLAQPFDSGTQAVLIPQPEQCCLLSA